MNQYFRVRTALLTHWLVLPLVITLCCLSSLAAAQSDLPSWNNGPAKTAIVEFVAEVTREGGPKYVPPAERIAVFDNDGTLWCEQPMYVQAAFVVARVRELVAKRPELREQEPYKALLARDAKALAAQGEKAVATLLAATHSGMTTDAFEMMVEDFLAKARHPRFNRPYTELVYQPMLELLTYLRTRGFKTFVVSGGGIDFMRPWTQRVYGIPPEQVVGSSGKLKFEVRDGSPVLMRLPALDFVDDGPGKPIGIYRFIGRRPILAFGNSDGDLEMLQYTDMAPGQRLALILHHDDAKREYAYDRRSSVGHLDKALDEAKKRGWTIVSMKRDFGMVFKAPQLD